nr:amidase family protein [Actinomadura madurae]
MTETALRRARELDPTLNAFVLIDEEGARAAAREADEQLAAGADRGPLHGIPVAVKDLVDMAGLPTTCGSATAFGGIAGKDAEPVRRLRDAGAVIIGKTTLHEFAYGATGDRSAHGPSRNPEDPGRMSGGSSGGSAVAVAARHGAADPGHRHGRVDPGARRAVRRRRLQARLRRRFERGRVPAGSVPRPRRSLRCHVRRRADRPPGAGRPARAPGRRP